MKLLVGEVARALCAVISATAIAGTRDSGFVLGFVGFAILFFSYDIVAWAGGPRGGRRLILLALLFATNAHAGVLIGLPPFRHKAARQQSTGPQMSPITTLSTAPTIPSSGGETMNDIDTIETLRQQVADLTTEVARLRAAIGRALSEGSVEPLREVPDEAVG